MLFLHLLFLILSVTVRGQSAHEYCQTLTTSSECSDADWTIGCRWFEEACGTWCATHYGSNYDGCTNQASDYCIWRGAQENGSCVTRPPAEWTCSDDNFGSGDGCNCECSTGQSQMDPDCAYQDNVIDCIGNEICAWGSDKVAFCYGFQTAPTISSDVLSNTIILKDAWAMSEWATSSYNTLMSIMAKELCKINNTYDLFIFFGETAVSGRSSFYFGGISGCPDLKGVIHFKTLTNGYTGPYFHELGHTWNVKIPSDALLIDDNVSTNHWGWTILDRPGYLGGWGVHDVFCKNSNGIWVEVYPTPANCVKDSLTNTYELLYSSVGSTSATNDNSPTKYSEYELLAMGAMTVSTMSHDKIIGWDVPEWTSYDTHERVPISNEILAAADPSVCESWNYRVNDAGTGCKTNEEMLLEFKQYNEASKIVCTPENCASASCYETYCWCPMTIYDESFSNAYCPKWTDDTKFTLTNSATQYIELTTQQFYDAIPDWVDDLQEPVGSTLKIAGVAIVGGDADLSDIEAFKNAYPNIDYQNTYFTERQDLFHTATDNLLNLNTTVTGFTDSFDKNKRIEEENKEKEFEMCIQKCMEMDPFTD